MLQIDPIQRFTKFHWNPFHRRPVAIKPEFHHLRPFACLYRPNHWFMDEPLFIQEKAKMRHALLFLIDSFYGQVFQAMLYLFTVVAALGRIGIHGCQHPDNSPAFFAMSTRHYLFALLMSGMTRHLMVLQLMVTFNQDFLDQKLGKGP